VLDEFITKHKIMTSGVVEGNKDRVEKQHKLGKLTARERLDLLLDPQSFQR